MADAGKSEVVAVELPKPRSFFDKVAAIFRGVVVGVSIGIVATTALLVVYRDEVDTGITNACAVVIDEKIEAGLCRVGGQGLDCSGKSRSVFGQGGNLSDPH